MKVEATCIQQFADGQLKQLPWLLINGKETAISGTELQDTAEEAIAISNQVKIKLLKNPKFRSAAEEL